MNWAKLLRSAEFTYNNSWSSTTKITLFIALYSYNLELRFDVEDAATKGETLAAYDRILYLHKLRDRLREEFLKS